MEGEGVGRGEEEMRRVADGAGDELGAGKGVATEDKADELKDGVGVLAVEEEAEVEASEGEGSAAA
jgi:hypothetical protein